MEVKGCTLEIDGVGYFPDAPTERGIKHLKELSRAARQGYRCFAAFVIQMEGVDEVRPNTAAHPQFAEALADAEKAGVTVLCLGCRVTEDEMRIDRVFCPQKEKVEQGGKPDGTGWQGNRREQENGEKMIRFLRRLLLIIFLVLLFAVQRLWESAFICRQ